MFKPVVNTNYGWAEELIDDGVNGFKLDPENIDGQAALVLQLFSDKERCRSIGRAARAKVEANFEIHDVVQQNIKFYKKLHANSSRA